MRSRLRLAGPLLALILSGCRCDGGPPTGVCNGTWGGVTFTDAEIDPESRYVTVYSGRCGVADTKKYDVSWGKGTVQLAFSYRGSGPSVLGEKTFSVPDGDLEGLTITPTSSSLSGTLKLGIAGVAGRRTGTLTLNATDEQLTCSFDLPLETEGHRPSCGGSSGGGSDSD